VIGAGEPETPERDGAFPRLEVERLARFRRLVTTRRVEPGDVLLAAGVPGPAGR